MNTSPCVLIISWFFHIREQIWKSRSKSTFQPVSPTGWSLSQVSVAKGDLKYLREWDPSAQREVDCNTNESATVWSCVLIGWYKYLCCVENIFSRSLSKWSEIISRPEIHFRHNLIFWVLLELLDVVRKRASLSWAAPRHYNLVHAFCKMLSSSTLFIKLFQLQGHVKRSNCVLTLHINVHHCRCLSTSVVCSALVLSSLSSVDVSDVQWVSLDVLTRCDICPHNSWIRITCNSITVLFHIVTFCDVFIFNLLHRGWDWKRKSDVHVKYIKTYITPAPLWAVYVAWIGALNERS